jgi:hypothetical protein
MKITNRKKDEPLNEWIDGMAENDKEKELLHNLSKESYIEGIKGLPNINALDFTYEDADNGFILSDLTNFAMQVYENGDENETRKRALEIGDWVYEEIDKVQGAEYCNKVKIRLFVEPINE